MKCSRCQGIGFYQQGYEDGYPIIETCTKCDGTGSDPDDPSWKVPNLDAMVEEVRAHG